MSVINIDIGADPQLDILDHTLILHNMLTNFQNDFLLQDRIWDTVTSKQPATTNASGLLSLGLRGEVFGPMEEPLLADCRIRS